MVGRRKCGGCSTAGYGTGHAVVQREGDCVHRRRSHCLTECRSNGGANRDTGGIVGWVCGQDRGERDVGSGAVLERGVGLSVNARCHRFRCAGVLATDVQAESAVTWAARFRCVRVLACNIRGLPALCARVLACNIRGLPALPWTACLQRGGVMGGAGCGVWPGIRGVVGATAGKSQGSERQERRRSADQNHRGHTDSHF